MRFTWLLAAVCWTLAIQPAWSDRVVLVSGGKVTGDLEETPGDSDAPRRIVSPQGVLELAPEVIVDIEREPPELIEYRDRARRAAMTLVDQWSLIEWCRQNSLYDEANAHCELILKLDPEHLQARTLLGYQKRNGEWKQREDYMQSRGFIRYDGRWRMHQQVQLLEERKMIREAQIDWWLKFKRWRESLGTPQERDNQIDFSQVRDPMAMTGLIRLLGREDNIRLQRLYVETLGNLDHGVALGFLIDHSVFQNNPEHREMCMIEVLKHRHPMMVELYVRFLEDYDNAMVNRAADCLAALDYPSAIVPLATALQTRHKVREFRQSAGEKRPHEVNPIFHYSQIPPNGRFDVAGPSPSYRKKTLDEILESSQTTHTTGWAKNESVYSALRTLTDGCDFGYHVANWKAWYTQQQLAATPVIQGRRGD
ncbi:hypothetical protein LOC68_18620 [Blastopirellula sp. JC732]|uniref:Tetratricopeptide repeat protein n=1 Tax=Blastopirellula sediminis TaxID=2894196 RepID=A0A9X1MNI0_9BACT|nr:hypothetical protein [Blastopirellula sediminis]MCC9606289.1 hypothetical protein [Blastopirellula sediminis]MCC9630413.1 hypothetical protein [Blastopirellula sediminis]